MKTITAAELKVGMNLVERDGSLLEVLSVTAVGRKIQVVCKWTHGETKNLVRPTDRCQIA